ncbi:enoyl-CoA hydratase [Terriglobus albidus]|uniref:Enoyl-CoA hydratase n=1 Tax=Terriglobus albidus TaxID=1592106 RepID=A0A5B9E9J7_9BACT|nr:enoyl-CoA hydratase-related protein [Terriglobus albidus]QEE28893.1 enoyl-CoA hydratase [Terriglobus albidus]
MSDIVGTQDGAILRIELNRPQKKNALTSEMYITIAELLNGAQSNPEVRVVLIHSSGDVFSAGNDLQDFIDHPPGTGDGPQKKLIDALSRLDIPLVAAVRGAAVGSGATMLSYCDFVYVGESSKFQYPFINLAVVPEFGTSFSLPEQVGYLRAAEVILLGHPFDATVAQSMGLVTKVLPDSEVFEVAVRTSNELAQKPAGALQASKQLMRRQIRPHVEQAVQAELVEFSEKVRSAEAREAFAAFFEKRPPRFNTSASPPAHSE